MSLMESAKSFSEIFEEVGKSRVEKYKVGWEEKKKVISGFSKSYLIRYLRELQHDGVIGKNKEGKYILLQQAFGNDYEVFRKLFLVLKRRKAKLPERLKDISELNDSKEVLFKKIKNLFLYYFDLYLTTAEITVNAPVIFRDLSWAFLDQATEEFLHTISACGNRDSEVTNSVLVQIKENLDTM
jgi:hypothetical protein